MRSQNSVSVLAAAALLVAGLVLWPASADAAEKADLDAGKAIDFRLAPDLDTGEPGGKPSRFMVRLYGGYGRIAAGDLNEGLDGYYELIELYAAEGIGTVTGGYSPLKAGYNFGADFIYQISPKIGVGLGVGYMRNSMSSLATWTGEGNIDLPGTAALSAVPIRLGLFVTLPLGQKLNLTADAGAAYYAALKFDATQRIEFDEADWQEMSLSASRSSFDNVGFQGSLGLEYMVTSKMGLFVEALGRYASFKNFETATGSNRNSGGFSETTEGKIYLMTYAFDDFVWSLFTLEETPPVSTPPSKIYTEPKIDLSGFSLQAGFRIRF